MKENPTRSILLNRDDVALAFEAWFWELHDDDQIDVEHYQFQTDGSATVVVAGIPGPSQNSPGRKTLSGDQVAEAFGRWVFLEFGPTRSLIAHSIEMGGTVTLSIQ